MLNYYIENMKIAKDKDNYLLKIKGWAFDSDSKINIKITDERGKIYPIDLVFEVRNDVYEYFDNRENALNCGIQAIVEDISKKVNYLQVHFMDKDKELGIYEINIKELIKDSYQKKVSLNNLKKVIKSFRRDGVITTAQRIMSKFGDNQGDLLEENLIEPYIFQEDKFSYIPQNKYNMVLVLNATCNSLKQNELDPTLNSINSQKVNRIIILTNTLNLLKYDTLDSNAQIDIIILDEELNENKRVIQYLHQNIKGLTNSFITLISGGDTLTSSAISIIYEALDHSGLLVVTSDEDRICDGEYIAPFYKRFAVQYNRPIELILRKSITIHETMFDKYIENNLEIKEIYIVNKVLYHYRLTNKANSNIKPIAFYLPQFHTFPENDEWWGKGFTEWTNTRSGKPLFEGHYQPHNPGELGYYDLVNDPSIQYKQISLAKEYGIYGFCYYYYWFNGKRLMEKPLDRVLKDKSLDFPFCICWANETWSRRWNGQDQEILIKQEHNEENDNKFIEDIMPILKDERYIKLGNAPILLIYRAELFPDLKKTIKVWKEKCKENGINELHVSLVQTFGLTNPMMYGGDSAVEFPPHSIVTGNIASQMPKLNKNFLGNIYDYRDVVARCLNKKPNYYKVFRGCMLSWDNTARRKNASNIFHYSDPNEYKKWVSGLIDYTKTYNNEDEQYIFINAWNEWAEGTHLEPDEKYGRAYLEVTKESLDSNY